MNAQTLEIFAGIAGVLILASVIGAILHHLVARGAPHAVIDNLNARIRSWWVLLLVVAAAFAIGAAGVTILFCFVSFIALREFLRIVDNAHDALPMPAPALLGVVAAQYALVYLGVSVIASLLVPLLLLLPLTVARASAMRARRRSWTRMCIVPAGVVICVFCLSHVAALLTMHIPGYEDRSLTLVLFLLVVVQSSDVLQYVFGKLLGRRKVAPRLSPSKTWAGMIGGIASATALGALLAPVTPFSAAQAALLAFVIASAGFCGGLALSAIKRARGAKDWGRLISGHGGVLDRVDSVVLAAPVFFYATRLGWT
jgi:phosphatidate cytidylyltransferase